MKYKELFDNLSSKKFKSNITALEMRCFRKNIVTEQLEDEFTRVATEVFLLFIGVIFLIILVIKLNKLFKAIADSYRKYSHKKQQKANEFRNNFPTNDKMHTCLV